MGNTSVTIGVKGVAGQTSQCLHCCPRKWLFSFTCKRTAESWPGQRLFCLSTMYKSVQSWLHWTSSSALPRSRRFFILFTASCVGRHVKSEANVIRNPCLVWVQCYFPHLVGWNPEIFLFFFAGRVLGYAGGNWVGAASFAYLGESIDTWDPVVQSVMVCQWFCPFPICAAIL